MRGEDHKHTRWQTSEILDHPRMRGEDAQRIVQWMASRGSPPHARGRHLNRYSRAAARMDHPRMREEDARLTVGEGTVQRITPACARKTAPLRHRDPWAADHPRMRGEDRLKSLTGNAIHGSPPHARGRHSGCRSGRVRTGITPACAGKTVGNAGVFYRLPDHPRMRGEDA